MADTPTNPLGPAHLEQINQALGQLAEAKKQAALATRAGIDVTATQQLIDQQESRLRQIKQVYFPGQ